MTRPTPASGRSASRATSPRPARAWSGWLACSPTSIPRAMDLARRFRALGVDVAIGGFHVSGTLAMLPGITPELQEATDLGIALYAGEAEDGLEALLRDAAAGTLQPLYNHMATLPNLAGVPIPYLPPDRVARTAGTDDDVRCGPRLPVPMQLLHHHQRAGPRLAPPHRRRRGGDRPAQRRAGRAELLHHRRQFRAQQGLGADLRPADRAARTGRVQHQADHPGGHAVPPHPALHREGGTRRRGACVHRSGIDQSRTACSRRRRSRTGSPSIAICCWPGSASAR